MYIFLYTPLSEISMYKFQLLKYFYRLQIKYMKTLRMRRQLVLGLVVRLSVIKAKNSPWDRG